MCVCLKKLPCRYTCRISSWYKFEKLVRVVRNVTHKKYIHICVYIYITYIYIFYVCIYAQRKLYAHTNFPSSMFATNLELMNTALQITLPQLLENAFIHIYMNTNVLLLILLFEKILCQMSGISINALTTKYTYLCMYIHTFHQHQYQYRQQCQSHQTSTRPIPHRYTTILPQIALFAALETSSFKLLPTSSSSSANRPYSEAMNR